VLDYVEALHRHHGGAEGDLAAAVRDVSTRWRAHEDSLTPRLLDVLAGRDDVRLLGPATVDTGPAGHRCPTIAFVPQRREPVEVAHELVARGVQTSSGHYYAARVLDGLGVDPDRGVVRLSFVHYTSSADVDRACDALTDVLR
jgi:selenocysteine lyase/cysteine desulfurase